MSKPTMYRQCRLVRQNDDGSESVDTAWIPNELARCKRSVRIKNEYGGWEDGWVVEEVFGAKSFDELQIERQAQSRFHDVLARDDE